MKNFESNLERLEQLSENIKITNNNGHESFKTKDNIVLIY